MTAAADWPRCRPFIEAALKTCRTHTIEDVEAGLEGNIYQFWAGERCAAITVIQTFPKVKALHHWLSGGDLRELVEQSAHIEAWARAIGCGLIYGTSTARPGLQRVMGRLGYRVGQVEYEKDLA